MDRCTCPEHELGRFWRLCYPDRPRHVFHIACGKLRAMWNTPRPLRAR